MKIHILILINLGLAVVISTLLSCSTPSPDAMALEIDRMCLRELAAQSE